MPATKHVKCRVCGVRTVHASARFAMCPRHEREHNRRRNAERREIKARVRARQARLESERLSDRQDGVVAMSERKAGSEHSAVPEPTPEVQPAENAQPVPKTHADYEREAMLRLGEAALLEIGSFYEDRRIKSSDIAREFSISNGVLTKIVDHLGLERRKPGHNQGLQAGGFTQDSTGKRAWIPDRVTTETVPEPRPARASQPTPLPDAVPEAQQKALENMLRLPARPEPVARARASQPTPPPIEHIEGAYEIIVTGTITMHADSMMMALAEINRLYPELHVQQVREIWPGLKG